MTGFANVIDPAVQLAPPRIADDAGVALTVHHLTFVELDAQAIADWRARRAPLGMRPATYRELCSTFFVAAAKDGYREQDIDIRLKGSASVIYSGRHKELPTEMSQWRAEFSKARHNHRNPSLAEETAIGESFQRLYFHQPLPFRRPFDSMFYLKVDAERSDYDIQLSSEMIERNCLASPIRDPRDDLAIYDQKYGFIYDCIAIGVLNEIFLWSHRWTSKLGRSVNVKAFGKNGPPNKTADIGDLSSHLRSEDWIIRVPKALE
jgi:hypothetical protein